jgi:DNA-directed RNA polymerase beta subunit
MKLLSQVTHSIRFDIPPDGKPYAIIFFPENGITLVDAFSRMGIRRTDARIVVVPFSKFPLFRMTSGIRKAFKSQGLYSFKSVNPMMSNKSLYIDLSYYFKIIDSKYKPSNYRARFGAFIKSFLEAQIAKVASTHRIVIMYSVDLSKGFNDFISRKSYVLLQMLADSKTISLDFDDLLFCKLYPSSAYYRLLMKEGKFNYQRIVSMFRALKPTKELPEEKNEEKVKDATDKIVDALKDDKEVGDTVQKDQIKTAINNLMNEDPMTADDITTKGVTPSEAKDIVIKSVLYSTSGKEAAAKRIATRVPEDKKDSVIKKISADMADEILVPPTIRSTSEVDAVRFSDPNQLVDKKVPTHIFTKRQIDFQQNLKKDLSRSFQVLAGKDVPLKLESLELLDMPVSRSEINVSDVSYVKVRLRDKFGNIHEVILQIPKIGADGTFRVNGRKKCLINQLVLCPISFPKKFDSRFESSYSHFHIYSKRGRRNYLVIYLGSYKLPLYVLLGYYLGIDNVNARFGIKHEISETLVKEKPSVKIGPKSFVVFSNVDNEVKKELVNSFSLTKPSLHGITADFGTKEYFQELIISLTKTRNSIWIIDQILDNIVDPVAKQVLINMQLPSELPNILSFMTKRVVEGYEERRNDISNQRIRNSEVLVHLAQKLILAAYTDYRKQVLAGNEDAKLMINPAKVLRDFINSEIVTDMEYANPAEEMATLSRLSPVGSQVGGISSKMAISVQARNVDSSYFGNIDPIDTPEGHNVGVVQQLTVGAAITSARGLFTIKPISDKEKSGILSTSSAMIPFVENNDGCRVLMACNQQRQILPIENPEAPLVQSGYESLLTNVLSDNFVKKAPCDGTIEKITSDYIEMSCSPAGVKIDVSPRNLRSGSGKNSLSIFRPIVREGQKVRKGNIIAEGACVSNGTIANGKSLLVCIMPYGGYNFEDGVIFSSEVVGQRKFNSIHLITEEFELSPEDRLTYMADIGQYVKKGEPLVKKLAGELEELIGLPEEFEDNREISAGEIILKSPGGTIADIDVYCNTSSKKFPLLKKFIDRTNSKTGIKGGYSLSGNRVNGALIVIKINQVMSTRIGDKFCNRYGNKGVVANILDKEMMPRTPWGEHIQMILNPLGVISRMNMGQIYEMYCGLISKTLGRRIVEIGPMGADKSLRIISNVINLLDGTKDKMYSRNLMAGLRKLSQKGYNMFLEQIKVLKGFPIIIPPFKGPSRQSIIQCLKLLGLDFGYKLFLPEFGTSTASKVPVGYMYITKLEHMSDMKVHGRSMGTYAGKTMQPLAGKSRGGGQRVGEGDTYAILGANAPHVLSEFFGPLSDDIKTKQEIVSDIITEGNAKFRQASSSPSKEMLTAYFAALGITED